MKIASQKGGEVTDLLKKTNREFAIVFLRWLWFFFFKRFESSSRIRGRILLWISAMFPLVTRIDKKIYVLSASPNSSERVVETA